jgi:hypothetical protein
MNTHDVATSELQEAKRRLLEEGAKVYVPGFNAIKEFQREVQTRCREMLEKRLADHSVTFGLKLDSPQIIAYDWADSSGDHAEVGAKVKIRGLPDFVYCLSLKTGANGEPSTAVCAYVWLQIKPATALANAFKNLDSNRVRSDRNSVWLEQELPIGDVSAFEEMLNEVVSRWLKLWERIGGLKAISETDSQVDE